MVETGDPQSKLASKLAIAASFDLRSPASMSKGRGAIGDDSSISFGLLPTCMHICICTSPTYTIHVGKQTYMHTTHIHTEREKEGKKA